ncbi:MAG: SsrA-binding protein SmpB [Candidatus Nealsonbacteria bacterium]|nr:SsrA-binding protein SmpB [Candidatus Nealsonbacteria bacterium]
MATLADNKKAYYDYEVLEKFEAGIFLLGQEVKSIKLGRINLGGSYVVLKQSEKNPEVFLIGCSVPPYQPKNSPADYDPQRSRKLLLKREEIKYLIGKSSQRGLTIIPLKAYTKKGKIKIEIGIAKGKKKFDKKELIKKRDTDREIKRAINQS